MTYWFKYKEFQAPTLFEFWFKKPLLSRKRGNYVSKQREVPVILWSVVSVGVQRVSNLHLFHFFQL